jgi:hypothetical protein
MTLEELQAETLVQKHIRLMQAKCKHPEVFSATFMADDLAFTDRVCLDCGEHWREDHKR